MGDRAVGLLDAIVRAPRPAGSRAEAAARAECARILGALGFAVSERPFEYSAFPGRLAMPVAGAALLGAALRVLGRAGTGSARGGLGTALIMVACVVLFAWWIGRFGTERFPGWRVTGVNLEGARGVPRVWLVAHLDTKTQPVPLLLRAAGVVTSAVAWGTLLVVWMASGHGRLPDITYRLPAALAAFGAIPLVLSFVSARSAGALDNGSGVATVLRAAELAPRDLPLGVLLTSAEELGLAGARAWVGGRARAIALNCDGVDDVGRVSVTVARDRSGALREAVSSVVTSLRSPWPLVVRGASPGVLLDASAFADAGWTAATVSRGGWRSLARVHTTADDRARLRGDGVEAVARLLAGMAGAMITAPEHSGPTGEGSDGHGATSD